MKYGDDEEKDDDDSSTPDWYLKISVAKARADFREALYDPGPYGNGIAYAWLTWFFAANARGVAGAAARAFAMMVERAAREGMDIMQWLCIGSEMRQAYAVFFSRAFVVIAEDPAIPAARIDGLMRAILRLVNRHGVLTHDAPLLRLATAAPLGRRPSADDLDAMRRAWRRSVEHAESQRKSEGDREGCTFCGTALAQILAETLLRCGQAAEALEVARQADRHGSPCMAACNLAPAGLLSACLRPLVEAGDRETAAAWDAKLAVLAPPGHATIAATAARAEYAALIGDRRAARGHIREIAPCLSHPDASAWQKLRCAEAVRRMGDDPEWSGVAAGCDALADSFARRNRHPGGSRE